MCLTSKVYANALAKVYGVGKKQKIECVEKLQFLINYESCKY